MKRCYGKLKPESDSLLPLLRLLHLSGEANIGA